MEEKNMALALLISFFLTGLGLVYVGDAKKGVGLFVTAIICNFISIYSFFFSILVFVVWAYGMYATYQEVNLVNGA